MVDFELAKDKVLMGAERKSMILSDSEKRITAYHEAGHALVAVAVPNADPLHKVSIIPRGMALGVTMQLPVEDKYCSSKDYCEDQLAIFMGGRIAEEIFMHQMTTGAGNDIERATDIARKMVCEWGMSELGALSYGKKEEQIFLGREIAQHRDYSEETAIRIDEQVKKLVQRGYDRARQVIEEHSAALVQIAEALLEREVLDGAEVKSVIGGAVCRRSSTASRRIRRTTRSRCSGPKADAVSPVSTKGRSRSCLTGSRDSRFICSIWTELCWTPPWIFAAQSSKSFPATFPSALPFRIPEEFHRLHLHECFSEVFPHFTLEQRDELIAVLPFDLSGTRPHGPHAYIPAFPKARERSADASPRRPRRARPPRAPFWTSSACCQYFDQVQGTDGFPCKPAPTYLQRSQNRSARTVGLPDGRRFPSRRRRRPPRGSQDLRRKLRLR